MNQINKPKVKIDEGSYWCTAVRSQEMSTAKFTQQNSNEAKKAKDRESLLLDVGDSQNEESDLRIMKIILEEDPNIFLLNNLLMSIQFFENYERDVEILRKNWFEEVSLESHHKKCFYADSLFRLTGKNVKFAPRHGLNKNLETSLHPFRIFISSDNVEAAFDPSLFSRNKLNLWPQYQFTVRTNETTEKSGYISLIEFKTKEAPIKSPKTKTPKNNFTFNDPIKSDKSREQKSSYFERKSVFEEKYNRRLTKIEKLLIFQNSKANLKQLEKRSSLKYTSSTEGNNSFYKFINSEARLTPVTIHEFRMNLSFATSHEIPLECFQREEVKNSRTVLNECFRSQNILNSTAFKGYFCDLLIEKLSESLSMDSNAISQSSTLEEFVIVEQKGTQYYFTPVITIRDWNNFVVINKSFQEIKAKQLAWPSDKMQKILNILPCNAVPTGYFDATGENLDYEKTWKLVFPKAEEFLLLHMMHVHIRCYFFVLLLYKSFIETEINNASFGPNHLMHLLFWRVHKNFLAWPEDRQGETLLNYLKILYKKLQNKFLSDFFITSRNLFANSLPKDLHKAQALIKKIIENPVPYIMRAVRNLNLDTNFYPRFDVLKLHTILNAENILEKFKKTKKEKKQKSVTFQDDEEQRWKKIAMKQIHLERKAEEEDQARKGSSESINLEKIIDLNTRDFDKCNRVLGMFTSHFIEMANKSLEYNFLSQAFLYLNQTQKLFKLSVEKGMEQHNLKATKQKINELKEAYYKKLKQDLNKSLPTGKPLQAATNKFEGNSKNVQKKVEREIEKLKDSMVEHQVYQEKKEKVNLKEETVEENEVFSIKL